MSVMFLCPRCGTTLQAPASSAGRQVACVHCNQVLTVPPVAHGALQAVTHCVGCGGPLVNFVQCWRCDEHFCSEACLMRHVKMTGHTTRRLNWRDAVIAWVVATVALVVCFGFCVRWLSLRPFGGPGPQPVGQAASAPVNPGLQGIWVLESMTSGGEPFVPRGRIHSQWNITGERIRVDPVGGLLWLRSDESGSPARFTIYNQIDGRVVDVFEGVYRLDGNRLTVHFGAGERPAGFQTAKDDSTFLATFRRH